MTIVSSSGSWNKTNDRRGTLRLISSSGIRTRWTCFMEEKKSLKCTNNSQNKRNRSLEVNFQWVSLDISKDLKNFLRLFLKLKSVTVILINDRTKYSGDIQIVRAAWWDKLGTQIYFYNVHINQSWLVAYVLIEGSRLVYNLLFKLTTDLYRSDVHLCIRSSILTNTAPFMGLAGTNCPSTLVTWIKRSSGHRKC